MADQGNEGLLSPFLRKHRIKAVCPYLQGDILDYGCGSGELASHVDAKNYYGVDIDSVSLALAKEKYPKHNFILVDSSCTYTNNLGIEKKFNTIVALAVIEHIDDKIIFLNKLSTLLEENGLIIITTPHPCIEKIHTYGAGIGLFSKHANEEHDELLDKNKLEILARRCGLILKKYKRFLFCANQLVVLTKKV